MAPKSAQRQRSRPNAHASQVVEYYRGHPLTEHKPRGKGTAGAPSAAQAWHPKQLAYALGTVLYAAFLPEGFPDSVSKDYISYQAWDTVQALCSYVRGMLTSQAILKGVGVGQQAATPLAAVFLFFVRDLAGMLGGILFAYLEGSSFDSCAKQWRLFADIINDAGMSVELTAPLLPAACFLPIACFGSVARSLCGVAAGATRAALTQHFARRGNTADVAAKEQSQETATTMVGMVLGMLFIRVTADHLGAAWAVFVVLTLLHVYANVRAMRCLVLASLNQPRLELIARRYLQDGHVTTPLEASQVEDLTPPPFQRLWHALTGLFSGPRCEVRFGCRLSALLDATAPAAAAGQRHKQPPPPLQQRLDAPAASALLLTQAQRSYLIKGALRPAAKGAAAPTVCVTLRRHAAASDLLRAYVHAMHLEHQLATPSGAPAGATVNIEAAEAASEAWMSSGSFEGLMQALEAAGWHVDRVTLPRPQWTAEWGGTHDE